MEVCFLANLGARRVAFSKSTPLSLYALAAFDVLTKSMFLPSYLALHIVQLDLVHSLSIARQLPTETKNAGQDETN